MSQNPVVTIEENIITASYMGETMTLTRQEDDVWLSYQELARLWGYKNADSVGHIIKRNWDEFCCTTKTVGQVTKSSNGVEQMREVRVVNRLGAYLFGMHCRTERGKQFRHISAQMWVAIENALAEKLVGHVKRLELDLYEEKDMKEYYRQEYKELLATHPWTRFLLSLEENRFKLPSLRDAVFYKTCVKVTFNY